MTSDKKDVKVRAELVLHASKAREEHETKVATSFPPPVRFPFPILKRGRFQRGPAEQKVKKNRSL